MAGQKSARDVGQSKTPDDIMSVSEERMLACSTNGEW